MRYLGIDVHTSASVWCLLDATGETVSRGKVPTTKTALTELVAELSKTEELLVGQEIGTLSTFVHDTVTAAKVRVLSFNAEHLRMIASSRKKTDRRDAYWLAKALQTGMTPHPVYIPTGQVRALRNLLTRREVLVAERKRWYLRAHTQLRASGYQPKRAKRVAQLIEASLKSVHGLDAELNGFLEMCDHMEKSLLEQLKDVNHLLTEQASGIDETQRLQTIPGVGPIVATTLYATIGEVSRFPNARHLASYVGLVPTVRQSAARNISGGITRQGSKRLRTALVQAAHVVIAQCRTETAVPLQRVAERIKASRGRTKIAVVAVVAVARHILRIAFYILRDATTYEPNMNDLEEEVLAAA